MIKMPNDWRDKAFTSGGTTRLPAGGYVCRVTNTEVKLSASGNEGLIVSFDIADGEYEGYFAKNPSIAWLGSKWQSTPNGDPKRDGYFFGMLTSFEESNPGFHIVIDAQGNLVETCLEGKYIGVVFQDQEEEYNGVTFFRARPAQWRSVEAIKKGDFKVSEPKRLPKQEPQQMAMPGTVPPGFEQISDDDIPF